MKDSENKESGGASGKQMKRRLGVYAVFAVCTGAMFSSGFFLLPGMVAHETGPSLPLAFLVASVLMLPAIFSMAELSAAIPRAGGPYLFLTRSMGPLVGMIGAFGKYMQLLLKGAFAFVGVGAYLSLVVDVTIEPVAIALIVAFTALNLFGVRQTAKTEIVMVAVLLVFLTYFTVVGIVEVASGSLALRETFTPLLPKGIAGFVSAIALVFVSFGGIGQVASIAEEVKKPARAMPRGMLYALGVATSFYLLGTAVMIILVPEEALRDDQAPVASAAENIQVLPLPVLVTVVAALAAFASTGNAAILSAARYPLALARDRLLWSKFGKLDNKGVPRAAVVATGILLVLLVLVFDVKGIAKLAGVFLLFVFVGMCVAVIIFRESRSKEYQPGFHSPLYPWMQLFGVLVYAGLIIVSGLKAIGFISAVCLLGGLWYYIGSRKHASTSAAIHQLFGRLAQQSPKVSARDELGVPMLGGAHLGHLIERAIVMDIEQEQEYEKVVERAADGLADHLGGKREEIAEHLRDEIEDWLAPDSADVAIAPVLLQGIEQPELVVVRGKFKVGDTSLKGLIALVDDEGSSSRLLELLTQLEMIIFHTGFLQDWENAENREQLKESLKRDVQNVQTLQLCIEDTGPTAQLQGERLEEASLPKGSLVMLIKREGILLVPGGSTSLQKGDEITLIAQSEAMKKLKKQFNQEKETDQ